jgi:hypothetical protein
VALAGHGWVCDANEDALEKENDRDEGACPATPRPRKEEAEVVQQDRGPKGRLPQATAGAADKE